MLHGSLRRSDLVNEGLTRSAIDGRLRSGTLDRRTRGVYATPDPPDDLFKRDLAAVLHRVGGCAAVSHRSAARLHNFDGFATESIVEVVTYHFSGLRSADVHRTRHLPAEHLMTLDALIVTTIARTLRDLGRVVSLDELELAQESVLRGPDPSKPAVWNEDILVELRFLADLRTPKTGATSLGISLARRPPNCRPTGSFAEMKALQGFRLRGLGDLIRQADIRIFDSTGRLIHHFYADFLHHLTGLIIEINGKSARGGVVMNERDVARANVITPHLTVLTYPAARVIDRSSSVAAEVHARVSREAVRPDVDVRPGAEIRRTPTGFDIYLR